MEPTHKSQYLSFNALNIIFILICINVVFGKHPIIRHNNPLL